MPASLIEREEATYSDLGEDRESSWDAFARYGFGGMFSTPDRQAVDMLQVIRFVTNLVKMHGVLSPFSVRFQSKLDTASGVLQNGYDHILLSSEPIQDTTLTVRDCMEVYGGYGIHEAEHLLSTPSVQYNAWLKSLRSEDVMRDTAERVFGTLLEDVRIENIAFARSPGYGFYLYRAREYTFQPVDWTMLSARSKFLYLIQHALRVPNLLTEDMQSYRIGRCCPYDVLRAISDRLTTFEDVVKVAKILTEALMQIEPDFESAMTEAGAATGVPEYMLAPQQENDNALDQGSTGSSTEPGSSDREVPEDEVLGSSSKETGRGNDDRQDGSGSSGHEDAGANPRGQHRQEDNRRSESPGEVDTRDADSDGQDEGNSPDEPEGLQSDQGSVGCVSGDCPRMDGSTASEDVGVGNTQANEPEIPSGRQEERDVGQADESLAEHNADAELVETRVRVDQQKEGLIAESTRKTILEVDGIAEDKNAALEKVAQAEKKADELEQQIQDAEKDKTGFGIYDMMKTSHGASAAVLESIEKLVDEKFEANVAWTAGDSLFSGRQAAVKQPRIDALAKDHYDMAELIIRPFVKKAEGIFRLRKATETRRQVDLSQGKLYRKRLATAMVSDRLFYRDETTQASGVSVCLLLDESGSMIGVDSLHLRKYLKKRDGIAPEMDYGLRTVDYSCVPGVLPMSLWPAEQALCVAVMLQRALMPVPRVDLHAYSHSSYGEDHEHCLVKHLYGGCRKEAKGLGGYCDGGHNYDHVAIRLVGQRFRSQALYPKQVMFYIADGAPLGENYGGDSAINATKKEVQVLERIGMTVVCIGVSGHDPKSMFVHSIAFKGDFSQLIDQMKKLVSRAVLRAGRETT